MGARLAGKVAFISGGARGLGAAQATAMAREGANVVIADLLEGEGVKLAASLKSDGHDARFQKLDVRSQQQWSAALDDVVRSCGRLDVLVNNAGIVLARNIEELSAEEFQLMLDVNLLGTFHGVQQGIARMKRLGGGSIINISSIAVWSLQAPSAGYGPTKAAVACLTKAAAVHCGFEGLNIRVNSVHPGPAATEMLLGRDTQLLEIPAIKALVGRIPLGRIAQPEDVAAAVLYLASDESRYITGTEMVVDGGFSIA